MFAHRKGKWIGGHAVLGNDIDLKGGKLIINPDEAQRVHAIYKMYLKHGTLSEVWDELQYLGWRSKSWKAEAGVIRGGKPISKSRLYGILTSALYSGMVDHKGILYPGEREQIVDLRVCDKVQMTLRQDGRGNGSCAKNKYGALLRGVLFCARCSTAIRHAKDLRMSDVRISLRLEDARSAFVLDDVHDSTFRNVRCQGPCTVPPFRVEKNYAGVEI